MSFAYAPAPSVNRSRVIPGPKPALREHERRKHRRFRFTGQARYSVSGVETHVLIRDISSGGVFLKTGGILRVGQRIRVFIDWPVLLENRCPLRLVMDGVVLRSDQSGTAVGRTKYEFKIRPTAVERWMPV